MWKGQAGPLLPPSAWQKGGGCSSKGISSSECTSCVLTVVMSSTGGAGQVFSTANSRGQSRALFSSCCSGCELLPTAAGPGAVTVDAASQLGQHLTAWDWTAPAWMLVIDQEPVCNPSILLPPFPSASLPGMTAWCILSEAVRVTHSSCWWEQNKRSSKAQAETKSRIVYAAEIFSV